MANSKSWKNFRTKSYFFNRCWTTPNVDGTILSISYPRQWITSGGLGTMGFGLPAAMGVARAIKGTDKVAVNFTGDGSILMNIQELMTCVEYDLPVINIILNNNYLGMVRQWQTMFYENRLSETDLTAQPNFKMLVEAFGGLVIELQQKKSLMH